MEVASAAEAADMLATLVGAGVRVLSFTPGASRLETTYLELDRMRSVDREPSGQAHEGRVQ